MHGHGDNGGGHAHSHGHASESHGHGHTDCCEGGEGHADGHSHDLKLPLLGPGSSKISETSTNDDQKKLKRAVYCALFFMMVEICGGLYANSLAIITDAAHMLSDVGGFVVSLVALQLAAKGSDAFYTYGYKQAEVLGALLSIAIVWALTAILLWEAVDRFIEPEEIDGPVMFVISVIGFLVNIVLMQVLGHGHSHGHGGDDHGHSHGGNHGGHDHGNEKEAGVAVQAAVAHVVGDIVQSLGVCLASVLIWWKPFHIGTTENGVSYWNYADPCCTVLFGILVLFTTKSTLVFTIESLMVKAPKHINQVKMMDKLLHIPHLESVHDLHVWSLGSKDVLCTAHLVINRAATANDVLTEAIGVAQAMGIGHTTFQVEVDGEFRVDCCPSDGSTVVQMKPKDRLAHNSGGHSHSHADGGGDSCCDGHAHDTGHGHASHSHGGHNGGHGHEAHGHQH